MTEKELNKLGFYKAKQGIYNYPKLNYFNNFYITSDTSLDVIFNQFQNHGLLEGIKKGREDKIKEI